MDKVKTFEKELPYICDAKVREFVKVALERTPDYFFTIPASSSGKYHPYYCLGEGGLLRHTRACIRIAVELYRMDMFNYFSEIEKDIILASLILHDTHKLGDMGSNFTVTEHPIVAAYAVSHDTALQGYLTDEQMEMLTGNISHHMGQWVHDFKTHKKVLDKPEGKMQNFVHLVDYLASRKCLEMNFDVELSRE
jgi:hypothetical protein